MTLVHILGFGLFALLAGWAAPPRSRGWLLLGGSVLAAYWLQPSTPIRNLDFWFPTASIALTGFVWAVTQTTAADNRRADLLAAGVVLGMVLAIGLTRYFEPLCCLTPTRPPELGRIALVLALGSVAAALPARLPAGQRVLSYAALLLLLVFFVVFKSSLLAQGASAWLRSLTGQSSSLATAVDLPWLGFSYLAFRLLHVLRDHQTGKLPALGLGEFFTYALFFPAYTAGPIDRAPRFAADLRRAESGAASPMARLDDLVEGGRRILVGVFKKFVLADSLALLALNAQNAGQVTSGGWLWVLLYAYALRIYFDFAGYTDIALGLGRLVGFRLPENFDRPYLRQNLTAFWNSWHITLAQWFRAYFFNPVTRGLRGRKSLPAWVVILVGQLGTMLLIGLWHGLTLNFVAWGAWHGLGLFVHNRWTDWIRSHPQTLAFLDGRPRAQRLAGLAGWFVTFHYVALGWVWFALPTPVLANQVFAKLFGL